MTYRFSEKEKKLLSALDLPFDPLGDLDENQEIQLLEALEVRYGDVAYDPEGDLIGEIMTHMAQQAE